MSPEQPLGENEVEVMTFEREHLSSVIYRTLGFVTAEVLTETLKRNPHLLVLPFLYPADTKIRIFKAATEDRERKVLTLWD